MNDLTTPNPHRLSPAFSGALRKFAFWMSNGTLASPLLDNIVYVDCLATEPSMVEMAFAIFANVIELDSEGGPTNAKYAEYRAAQYIRAYCDEEYIVEPQFSEWETCLY